jgi:hypothetical protein
MRGLFLLSVKGILDQDFALPLFQEVAELA